MQKKILVVDDSKDNLQLITKFLLESKKNYAILNAINGKMANIIAIKKQADLIIMDWEMPEMNGIEAIKLLKKNEKTKDIPVIMSSGVMTSSENLQTALNAGAIDYIKKPIDKIELQARVHSALLLSESYKKLKKINAEKDKFFSIIAHDLRNPFHTIIGFSDILLNYFETLSEKQIKEYIGLIYQTSQDTHKLLVNLLEWAKTQTRTSVFNPQKINLNKLLEDVLILIKKTAHKKSIQLLIDIQSEDNFVFADINMLKLVFRNILNNAIKFTNKNGKINIKIYKLNTFIKVSIKDNGVGISKENLKNLFKIGENFSSLGTDNEKGTGLGLLLCKEFIRKNGGEIDIESQENNGTDIYFTLKLFA